MQKETHRNARILIVDDEEANVRLLETMLQRVGGYTNLKSTTNSPEAFSLYAAFEPDLILLDLHMPDLDGFAVMDRLKSLLPATTYLPVLVITADITAEAKQRALMAGAKDFLVKPFDQTEVLLRIKNLLETRFLHVQLQTHNALLGETVRERTQDAERRLRRLQALHEIEGAISGSTDLHLILHVFLGRATAELQVDAAAILVYDRHTHTLDLAARRGFLTAALQYTHLGLGEGHAGRAAEERRLVSIPNLAADPGDFSRAPLLAAERFVAYYGVPLLTKGEVTGVLEIFHRARLTPNDEWLEFLNALAGTAAIAIENAVLFDDLQRSHAQLALAYDATLEGWCRTLDLRDEETEGHTRRVVEMSVQLARALGVSGQDLVHLRRGALLHDIGKMAIPDRILLKPGPLSPEEWEVMRRHPVHAFELLSPIAYIRPALDIPYCHHEKWDGTGYPQGLKGDQIPLAARIFAVVDVWDALRSNRPYRPAWTEEKARAHITEQTGKHFDPHVVEAFLHMIAGVA